MKKFLVLVSLIAVSQVSFSQNLNSVFQEFSQLKKTEVISNDYNSVLKSEVTSYLSKTPDTFDKHLSQYFILVDSSFKKQNLALAFWDSSTQSFQLSPNMTKVSTGRTGSVHHW